MKCLNTYGCQNEAPAGQVFCSEKCRLIYRGELKPDYSAYKIYRGSDPELKIIDDIFQKYYGCKQEQKKQRGVKPGMKRGEYGKPRLARMEEFKKEQERKRLQRERTRECRERKKKLELAQKRGCCDNV